MDELTREKVIEILGKSSGMIALREDVATKVLAGMLANPVLFTHVAQRSQPEQIANRFADLALQHTDALLVQLTQPLTERYPEPKPVIEL